MRFYATLQKSGRGGGRWDDETARGVYDGLSFTHRKEYARWIAGAKRQETRERPVRKAIEMLSEGIKHP